MRFSEKIVHGQAVGDGERGGGDGFGDSIVYQSPL